MNDENFIDKLFRQDDIETFRKEEVLARNSIFSLQVQKHTSTDVLLYTVGSFKD